MAVELVRNLAETTLASGYTAGAGSISVNSAAGFPTTGTFRVRLGNTGKTIFRVDSVSGTTFTGAAEANDANANSGDKVVNVLSRASVERLLQSPAAGEALALSGVDGADEYGPIYKLKRLDQSGWAWVNQGSATVTQADGIVALFAPANSGESHRLRVTTPPATPYTITMVVKPALAVGDSFAGFARRDSATGRLHCFGVKGNSAVASFRFTSPTLFNAHDPGSPRSLSGTCPGPIWLRTTDDGTNFVNYYSLDGRNFVTMNTISRTVWLANPDQIGIDCDDINNSTGMLSVLSWVQS